MKTTRALATLLLSSTPFLGGGCSVVGFHVGAGTPRYESVTVDTSSLGWRDRLREGEEIEIRARAVRSSESFASSTPWREATYEGVDDDTLAVSTTAGPDRIPLSDIEEIRVRRGNHWVTGLVVGALVDTLIVGFIAASLSGNTHVDLSPSAAH